MNTIKQTLRTLALGLFLAFGLLLVATPSNTYADCDSANAASCCDGVATSIIACDPSNAEGEGVEGSGIWAILIMTINVLSAGVGVIALAGIVYASILYTSAGGNQENVKKAMGIISNIVIGVIAYALMFSLLNFLIPGGLFNT